MASRRKFWGGHWVGQAKFWGGSGPPWHPLAPPLHWIHCIENIFTVQNFWTICTCPEKQSWPWNFSLYWIYIFTVICGEVRGWGGTVFFKAKFASIWIEWSSINPPLNWLLAEWLLFMLSIQWRTRRGGSRPPAWKIQGKFCFQGQAKVAQKSWKIKNIWIQWKIPGQILIFRASAGCSKFWMIKNIYSIEWIQAHSVFQGKHKLIKNTECKNYFQYSEKFQGRLRFQSKRKLLKKSPER